MEPGDFVLRGLTGANGRVTFRFMPYGPAPITVQARGENVLPAEVQIQPAG